MGQVHILTSTFTIVEVIRPKTKSIPTARRLTADEIAKIKGMFRWPFITTIELDERTALLASDLARDYGLAPADAVQAASAILWKADALQAWDRDFSPISNQITVEQPYFLSAQQTFPGMEKSPLGPTPEDFGKTR